MVRRLRVELEEVVLNSAHPIEAAYKNTTEQLDELRADQHAFLLREKSVHEAVQNRLDDCSQEMEGRAQQAAELVDSHRTEIEELKEQHLSLLQLHSDSLRFQESLEVRLCETQGNQESVSQAYSLCAGKFAHLRLEFDEFRALVASRDVSRGAAAYGLDTLPVWSELQRALLQHVADCRAELSESAAEASRAARARLDEVEAAFCSELREERAARFEHLESLAGGEWIEQVVARAVARERFKAAAGTGECGVDSPEGSTRAGGNELDEFSSAQTSAEKRSTSGSAVHLMAAPALGTETQQDVAVLIVQEESKANGMQPCLRPSCLR